MPRNYILGFTLHFDGNLRWSGQDVQFDGPSASEFWSFRVSDEFYAASSNVYSVDHVFDADNCFHYLPNPVPSPAFVYIGLAYPADELCARIGFYCLGTQLISQRIDLPPVTTVWTPCT